MIQALVMLNTSLVMISTPSLLSKNSLTVSSTPVCKLSYTWSKKLYRSFFSLLLTACFSSHQFNLRRPLLISPTLPNTAFLPIFLVRSSLPNCRIPFFPRLYPAGNKKCITCTQVKMCTNTGLFLFLPACLRLWSLPLLRNLLYTMLIQRYSFVALPSKRSTNYLNNVSASLTASLMLL